jgi:hypothetical protein
MGVAEHVGDLFERYAAANHLGRQGVPKNVRAGVNHLDAGPS